MPLPAIDRDRLIDLFLRLVRVDSPSGEEAAVAELAAGELAALGCNVERDAAGNVIARREGRGAGAAREPLLLSAHMDTVQPGRGITPIIEGEVIRSDGTTILGADDKAGMAAILEALRVTHDADLPCRPVEVIFTVQEEIGLKGAKALDLSRFRARSAIVLDSDGPVGTIINEAPAQNSITVTVLGRAAHAGVAPEQGINAIQAAARGLATMRLGRIDAQTTANFGVIRGGTASNVVPERVELLGEARSRDEARLQEQTEHMVGALERAAAEMGARIEASVTRTYSALRVPADSALVQLVASAMRACGIEPQLRPTGGGSDANVLHAAGIPTLNLAVGFQNPHSVQERLSIMELARAGQVLAALLTA